MRWVQVLSLLCGGSLLSGCLAGRPQPSAPVSPLQTVGAGQTRTGADIASRPSSDPLTPFQSAVVASLEKQTAANTVYDSSYVRGGVPPVSVGVCSDVAIRAFSAAGVDLKRAVTTDIKHHTRLYPLSHPDPNIDHRRCRNLVVYFRRHAQELPITPSIAHWQPGDIVFWSTGGRDYLDHIGIIGAHLGASGNPTVVQHLPGQYVTETDSLYRFQVLHHFRWTAH